MNNILVINAILLLIIGFFVFFRKKDKLSFAFLMMNIGFSSWGFCYYLYDIFKDTPTIIDLRIILQIEMLATIVFSNGGYYFSYIYHNNKKSLHYIFNLILICIVSWLIFNPAMLLYENNIVKDINTSSIQYMIYSLYLLVMIFLVSYYLIATYIKYKERRNQTAYLFVGLFTFMLMGAIFDLILPILGNLNLLLLGHLGTPILSGCFAYAITKHHLMDIKVIIKKGTSYLLTILFILITLSFTFYYTHTYTILSFLSFLALGLFWSFAALPLQEFLITTAKRTFIKGYYDPQKVINLVSQKIALSQTREDVFLALSKILDDEINFEEIMIFCADKNENSTISKYSFIQSELIDQEQRKKLPEILPGNSLITYLEKERKPVTADALSAVINPSTLNIDIFNSHVFKNSLIFPLASSESLEGFLIFSQKSSGARFKEADLELFQTLANIVLPVFDRIRPFEEIKEKYKKSLEFAESISRQASSNVLVKGISHELRNAFCILNTRLDLMRVYLDNKPKLEENIGICEQGIERIFDILNRMLEYTKSQKDYQKTGIDLNEIIKEIERLATSYIEDKKINLKFDLKKLPKISGDSTAIYQAVMNLLLNAIQAIEKKGEITISTYEESFLNKNNEHKKGVVVAISDTGKGIPEKIQKTILEPFFTTKHSANENQNLGLGLAIVLQILDAHSGMIDFKSTVNKGTTFKLFFPV